MVASVFDLFKIGVGPSSSHTMGPMTAACRFVEMLGEKAMLDRVDRVEINLYGSLALTGKGHATDRAILIGLSGKRPDRLCPDVADRIVDGVGNSGRLLLGGSQAIAFDEPLTADAGAHYLDVRRIGPSHMLAAVVRHGVPSLVRVEALAP